MSVHEPRWSHGESAANYTSGIDVEAFVEGELLPTSRTSFAYEPSSDYGSSLGVHSRQSRMECECSSNEHFVYDMSMNESPYTFLCAGKGGVGRGGGEEEGRGGRNCVYSWPKATHTCPQSLQKLTTLCTTRTQTCVFSTMIARCRCNCRLCQ